MASSERSTSAMNAKTPIFFGPPLALLTKDAGNTMLISGKINRTAERYMEMMRRHGLELSEPESACLRDICAIGFMSPQEISELSDEVSLSLFEAEGLDKVALAAKLASADYADLVSVVESLGF